MCLERECTAVKRETMVRGGRRRLTARVLCEVGTDLPLSSTSCGWWWWGGTCSRATRLGPSQNHDGLNCKMHQMSKKNKFTEQPHMDRRFLHSTTLHLVEGAQSGPLSVFARRRPAAPLWHTVAQDSAQSASRAPSRS